MPDDYAHRDGYLLVKPARFLHFRFQRHIEEGAIRCAIRWRPTGEPLELLSLSELTPGVYSAVVAFHTTTMRTPVKAEDWIAVVPVVTNFTIDAMGRRRPVLESEM